jgi:hypothetical protein
MRKTIFTMGLLVSVSACTLDEGADPETGSSEQLISGWATGSWGTTTDLIGADTGWHTATSTCVLTKVQGNLGDGGWWDVEDEPSVAEVQGGNNGDWFMIAHGGAYTNQVNARVWSNNPVNVGVVCVPYKESAGGAWKTQPARFGVAPPVRITGLAATRRCFLTGIIGGGENFTHAGDSMIVKQVTTPDATHSTTGWYVEGTVASNYYTEQPSYANAACIDFPTIAGEWTGAFGNATNTLTTNGGNKMCGLTGLYGAFNVNSYSDGAAINSPASQAGNWTMTVSANKYATNDCIM